MSGRTIVIGERHAKAWEEAKAFCLANYKNQDECQRRLKQELARIESLPTSIEVTIRLEDPVSVWRALVVAAECAQSGGHDDLMFALHNVAPFLLDWGSQVGQQKIAALKECYSKAYKTAEAQAETPSLPNPEAIPTP